MKILQSPSPTTYLVSMYNRFLNDENSTGPDDPTTTVYEIPSNYLIPSSLLNGAIRCIVKADDGFVVYANRLTDRKSLTGDFNGYYVKEQAFAGMKRGAKIRFNLPLALR